MSKPRKPAAAPAAAAPVQPEAPTVAPEAPAPRLSDMPGHVLVTSEVLSVLFRRAKGGRPLEAGLDVAAIVRRAQHAAEQANDWTGFYPAVVQGLFGAGFTLAADFTHGHSVGIDLRPHAVHLSASYCPKGSNPDDAAIVEIGAPHVFERWCASFTEGSEQASPPAPPAPKSKVTPIKAPPAPRKVVAAAAAPDTDRLAKARAQLRATLKRAKQAA